MPYPFLLSYARKDARTIGSKTEDDPHFATFIQRLNQRVAHLTGDTGFVDERSIEAGEDWPDELAAALQTAHSMVCLYSPSYFGSAHCGKEMQVLLERRHHYIRTNAGKKPANIIPVLWHSTPWRIPRTLPDIQYKASKLDPNKHGAWDLGDKGMHDDLKSFADEIAFRVRDAIEETPLPPLDERPSIKALHSAFDPPPLPLPEFDSPGAPQGPNTVTFVYAGVRRWNAWLWAPPEDRAVLHLAASVAKGKEMQSTQLTFDLTDRSLRERLAALRSRNNVVVLLLEAASLDLEGFAACLSVYDRPEHEAFATIVICHDLNEPMLDPKVRFALPSFIRRPPPYFSFVDDRRRFSDVIENTLETLRLSILGDSRIRNSLGHGSSYLSLPTISGPGGEDPLRPGEP